MDSLRTALCLLMLIVTIHTLVHANNVSSSTSSHPPSATSGSATENTTPQYTTTASRVDHKKLPGPQLLGKLLGQLEEEVRSQHLEVNRSRKLQLLGEFLGAPMSELTPRPNSRGPGKLQELQGEKPELELLEGQPENHEEQHQQV